ncbi:hydantoinase/oxoprolinase family protein [Pigmentiphaga litoralis]|uniref:hydantoinase/oxoprolinase family protein n=1 Tax=Pigmentiphaga litoralis TaxID=516702 RepID=UPI003B42FAA6
MDGIASRADGVDGEARSGALPANARGWEVAVDVGGTFVDVIAVSPDGVVHPSKHARRGAAPAEAVLAAVDAVASVQGFCGADVTRWLHGTTLATNLLLEQDAAPIGVLVPRGFADVLTLGRQSRRDVYASHVGVQTPVDLIPEDLRIEIDGRLDARGIEIEPLTRSSVAQALAALHAAGVRSVAICLLFSHRNPAHERQVAAWCAELSPALQVSLSSDVDPRPREFERWLTTAMDAYVKPGVSAYLQALKAGLAERGYPAPWVMRSFGGIAPVDECAALPIALAMSGPAAAVNGVARMIDPATSASVAISIDIGGTTSDLSLLEQGAARYTQALAVGQLDLRVRSLDIVSIAMGGGSIVRVTTAGALRIGPDSAGARPGPAAYGQGGQLATVTDCLVVLGRLPERLASGLMLDRGKAEAAVNESVAAPLGLSVAAAAAAALAVANASLAEAIKRTAFAAGVNPREVTLVAAGGGGGCTWPKPPHWWARGAWSCRRCPAWPPPAACCAARASR